jgi:hypothetical protein
MRIEGSGQARLAVVAAAEDGANRLGVAVGEGGRGQGVIVNAHGAKKKEEEEGSSKKEEKKVGRFRSDHLVELVVGHDQ